ncbi:MAG TPA: Calx-beta domain-containing protein [Pyrinomonadaceae bacterium]|nr:Calx-beta domain-containing protein [Pyrinomonadaceae bacterium]
MTLTKKSTRNALLAGLVTAALILALSVGGVVTRAQSGFEGDYDLSFATNGYYVDPEDPVPTVDDYQTVFGSGALLPDGSIITGGRHNNGSKGAFYLRKFTPTGAVDAAFGMNGLVRTTFYFGVYRQIVEASSDSPQVLRVQPDGKILIAGQCQITSPNEGVPQFGTDACLMRLNPDGSADDSFGNVLVFTGGGRDGAGEQGKTYSFEVGPGRFMTQTGVITAPGAPPPQRGTNGIFFDMEVQPDGKIVLVGETRNEYYNDSNNPIGLARAAFIMRLNANGTRDFSFGDFGISQMAATPTIAPSCYPETGFQGVRVQADGRIIAVGYINSAVNDTCAQGNRFAVTRWTANGQLERTRVLDNNSGFNYQLERATTAFFTRDVGKLIVSGSYACKATMVRLNVADLSVDTTFGTNGIRGYAQGCGTTLYIKAIQPDGKIIGTDAGNVPQGNVVRFNADGSSDQSFGNESFDGTPGLLGRLRVYVTHYNGVSGNSVVAGDILVRPNGRINLVGYSAAHAGLGILRAVVTQQNTELPTYTVAGRVLNGAGSGVSGVTVKLTGAQSASRVTDASGNYSFANLPMGGNFTVTPSKAGLTFVPASKSFANLSADRLAVNFSVPSLSVNNVAVTEGNTGELLANFTLALKPASTQAVTVKYQTASSTALSPGDYTAVPLTAVTFAPGQTTKTVSVKVKGDTLDEANETFRLLLSAPAGAVISDNEGVCTITDNDAAPSLRVGNVAVTEGNAAVAATFTVTLSAQSAQTVTVKYATANGTALAGRDYTAKAPTTLTFSPFQTTKTVAVAVAGDLLDEPAETFKLVLSSPTNATIATATGTCTITDNDPAPSVTINNVTVTEPDSGTRAAVFTVKLSAASGQTVTVKYVTANGTAASGSDYTALALTTLTFSPGQVSKTVAVPVRGDLVKEANETFFLNLSAPTLATIADAQGLGTIANDD